jgi:aspartate-semialdehyde dehydrogenase
MNKLNVAILGATGMVGQRFIALLENHPWFEVACVAASPRSAGKPYSEAVVGRWLMNTPIPSSVATLKVLAVEEDLEKIANQVDFVFSALDLDKDQIKKIEEHYAARGIPVVSNNSAHRWTPDVPMIMPELNHGHANLIDLQKKNRGWGKGFIVVKPNCSLQTVLPPLHALRQFGLEEVLVTTFQAISGAGKTFETWPEMVDNVIPFIGGEEEKTEQEPMKIWAELDGEGLKLPNHPKISAQCIRVPASDGHLAAVSVRFKNKVSKEQILDAWEQFKNPLGELQLPSSPPEFLHYFSEDNRPQTRLDRDLGKGMTISIGRLRPDPVLDWKFVCLSHNTIRGAAGGAILTAELLKAKGYFIDSYGNVLC